MLVNFKKELQELVKTVKKNSKLKGKELSMTDIAKLFKKDRSYFSTLISENGRAEVTQEHIEDFKRLLSTELGDDATNDATPNNKEMLYSGKSIAEDLPAQSLYKLAHANEMLAEANKKLTDELIALRSAQPPETMDRIDLLKRVRELEINLSVVLEKMKGNGSKVQPAQV